MKKTIKLSLILVALISQLQAGKTVELQALTVTSTAIKTDELKSTDAVEVYTSEDVEKAHVQNVYEFLNTQTSVISMPSYGNPFAQKLDFHGYGIGDGYQNIVITINGRKINNMDMVAPLLNSIAPSSIKTIEIIKSSGIVTAGDGANAGVINITTKKNNDKEVTFYGGTYGAFDGSFYLGHSDEKLSLSASGEAQKNDGIRDVGNSDNKDENKLSTGTLNIAYSPTEKVELRTAASFTRTDVIYAGPMSQDEYESTPSQSGTNVDSFPQGSTYSHQLFDTDVLSIGGTYYINNALSLNMDASREKKKTDAQAVDTSYTYPWISDYIYDTVTLKADYKIDFMEFSTGVQGLNGTRNSHATSYEYFGTNYVASNETYKNNLAAFMATQFYFDSSTIKAGYRYEKVTYEYNNASQNLEESHSLHGFELGYNYALSNQKSLFFNYAHAYQSPDIDRFFSTDFTTKIVSFNGFIEPMQTNNYTLGYNNITTTNKFKTSLFYVDLQNEIYYYADPAFTNSKNTNIDKSHKYGIDVYDKYIISGMWNVALNYNYVQAIIDDEQENGDDYAGNNLPGVSNHNAKATLSYLPTPHATIALTQNYRSEAYAADDFNNNFAQKQDAYNTTDISATYAKENYEVFAKINNLFNQSNGMWIKDDAIYPINFTTTAIAGFKLKY